MFGEVLAKLREQPKRWFVPLQTEEKWVVLNEEVLCLYLNRKLEALSKANHAETYANLLISTIESKRMEQVSEEIQNDENLNKLANQFLPVKQNESAADVNNKMEELKVYLALVMDDYGKYTHYFTTKNIRKVLLRM